MPTPSLTWRQRLRAWQIEPWPLHGWRGMPRAYQVITIAWPLILMAANIVVWSSTEPPLSMPPIAVTIGALAVTLYVCITVYRQSGAIQVGADESITLPLMLAGMPLLALVCSVAGRCAQIARKPLTAHLAISNIVNGVTVLTLAAGAMTALGAFDGAPSARWALLGYCVVIGAHLTIGATVTTTVVLGGYMSWRDAWTYELSAVRELVTVNAPLAVVMASVMWLAPGSPLIVGILLLPHFLILDAYRRTDRMVAAQREAGTDPLTGIASRRGLDDFLSTLTDRGATGSWLVVIDLDNFKQLNDTHGHIAGDIALRDAAQAITEAVDDTAFVARPGGDEFVVVLQSSSTREARATCERLGESIYARLGFMHVTASIGAHQVRPDENIRAALNYADRAMYHAKKNGRARVVLSNEAAGGGETPQARPLSHALPRGERSAAIDEVRSQTYWQRVLDDSIANGDTWNQARASVRVAQSLSGDADARRSTLARAQRLTGGESDGDIDNGWAWLATALLARDDGDDATSRDACKQALDAAREAGDRVLEFESHVASARAASRVHAYDDASAHARAALDIGAYHAHVPMQLEAGSLLCTALTSNLQLSDAYAMCASLVELDAPGATTHAQSIRTLHRELGWMLCATEPALSVDASEPTDNSDMRRAAQSLAPATDAGSPLHALMTATARAAEDRSAHDAARCARMWQRRGALRAAANAFALSLNTGDRANRERVTPHVEELISDLLARGAVELTTKLRHAVTATNEGTAKATQFRTLADASPFAQWPREVVAALAPLAIDARLDAGESLLDATGGIPHIAIVSAGTVGVLQRDARHELLVYIPATNSALGLRYLHADTAAADSTDVLALTDATLTLLRASDVAALTVQHEHAGPLAAQCALAESLELSETVAALTATPVIGRLTRALLHFDAALGRDTLDGHRVLDVPLSQDRLATMLGTSRQSLHTARKTLLDAGAITLRKRSIVITDMAILQELHAQNSPDASQRFDAA